MANSLSYSSSAVLPISGIKQPNLGNLVNLIWSRVQTSKLPHAILKALGWGCSLNLNYRES